MFNKKSLFLIIIFSITLKLSAEGILSHPRKVFVIQTEYFDIMFPKECKETAKLLADNGDAYFEKACKMVQLQKTFRMPVIISPDSDELSVKYTASPYNRIIIFEGVPDGDTQNYGNTLLNMFFREVYLAQVRSIRSPFNQFLSDTIAGAGYQPVYDLNLPFSFIEGLGIYVEDQETEGNGEFSDGYYLQLLSQAKLENKFPSHFSTSVTYDIYPGNDLIVAAQSAFSAWLIQTYGLEKYAEIWRESGKLHPYFTAGIFYKVYGKFIDQLWMDFEDSVPLPENLEQMEQLEQSTQMFFPFDNEGLYEQTVLTDYGLVWYDGIRHEVDIYDFNSNLQIRQLLFLADNINKISLSPDGRYLVISNTENKNRDEFKQNVVWIYDLKERKKLSYSFKLRDGVIVSDGEKNYLAGVNVQKKNPVVQVWSLEEDEDDCKVVFQKSYDQSIILSDLNNAGNGKLSFILAFENHRSLCQLDYSTGEEAAWSLFSDEETAVEIKDLKFQSKSSLKNKKTDYSDFIYTFSYVPANTTGFTRMGYITLNDDFTPDEVYHQTVDLSGGVNFPVWSENQVYYCAKKLSHNELRSIPTSLLEFKSGIVKESSIPLFENKEETPFTKKNLGEYELSRYRPFKYLFPPSVTPGLPIQTISGSSGAMRWPGLGITVTTQSDPYENNKIQFSAGWAYLEPDFELGNNLPQAFAQILEKEAAIASKDKSAALFLENSSTPVDIRLGALFRFDMDGKYIFQAVAGTNWDIPVGMSFSKLKFDVTSDYSVSTDYYDVNLRNIYTEKPGWTGFDNAYSLMEMSSKAEYTNIHQYGVSQYEKRGLSLGARLYSIWDVYKMDKLEKWKKENTGDTSKLTEAQVQELYLQEALKISQLNIGFFGQIEIPRLNPLEIKNGWVLSLPATVSAEFLNTTGTALEAKSEVLLIGKEAHDGFRFLQLHYSRFGLKAGYDIRLNYDTKVVAAPDIRRSNYVGEIISNTYFDHNLSVTLDTQWSCTVGSLSQTIVKMDFAFLYFPKTNGWSFGFDITANF